MSGRRRDFVRALAAAPVAWALGAASRVEAAEYTSAVEVLDAIDRLEADVAARLRGLVRVLPSAKAFADSAWADHARHRASRAALRDRLRLAAAAPRLETEAADRSLAGLRAAQEALVFAHAEGLPALGDPVAVDRLARHMNDLSRHLTIVDLWIEAEQQRG